jgi:hypothetical protein
VTKEESFTHLGVEARAVVGADAVDLPGSG